MLFLCSELSNFIHGQVINVTGGQFTGCTAESWPPQPRRSRARCSSRAVAAGGRRPHAWSPPSATRSPPGPRLRPQPRRAQAIDLGDDPAASASTGRSGKTRTWTIRNCGVFGERTDEIALRLDDCARRRRRDRDPGRDQRHRPGPPGRGGGGEPARHGPRGEGAGTWRSRSPTSCPGTTAIRRPTRDRPAQPRDPRDRPAARASRCSPSTTRSRTRTRPGTMKRGVDRRRRPPLGRGLPAARRARLPRRRRRERLYAALLGEGLARPRRWPRSRRPGAEPVVAGAVDRDHAPEKKSPAGEAR